MVSMLFHLLLANTTVLLCFFFLFCVVFNNVFTIPVDSENAKLKFALSISIGAPITVANDATEMLPQQMKQLKTYQNNQKKQCIY